MEMRQILTHFHRGGGEDLLYLNLLAEIRTAPRQLESMPDLSGEAMRTLQKIRDREGGARPPR